MKKQTFDISKLQPHPNNPRTISEEEESLLDKSISEDPEILTVRPIAYDSTTGWVWAGNQRLKSLIRLGYSEIPKEWVKDIVDWSEEKKLALMFKDNKQSGEWDWDIIESEFKTVDLASWGIIEEVGELVKEEDFDDAFSLKSGEKDPYQQMSFCLADEQAETIKEAIAEIKQTEEYKYIETFGNNNTSGNALYLIIQQWAKQKR